MGKREMTLKYVIGVIAILLLLFWWRAEWFATHPIEVYHYKTAIEDWFGGVRKEADHLEKGSCKERCECFALVHGLGDRPSTWREILRSTPKDNELLIAVEVPAGESPKTAARSLHARLNEHFGSRCARWTWVGNSLGGWIAAWVAVDQDVARLVLLAPAGLDMKGRKSRAVELLSNPTVENLKAFQALAYHKPRELPEELWKKISASAMKTPLKLPTHVEYLDGELDRISEPTKILWGESDRVLPEGMSDRWRNQFPRAEQVTAKACGHMPQKECPEEVLKLLR